LVGRVAAAGISPRRHCRPRPDWSWTDRAREAGLM